MADADPPNNDDLMKALESLRSLINKDPSVDASAIPTLKPEALVPNRPPEPAAETDPEPELHFNEFWKILKPKLKQAAKESFNELLAQKRKHD